MSSSPRRADHAWLWFLLPLAAAAGTRGWWAPDEPRYAEVAREVYASGDFLVMHLCTEPYGSKPPLLFWISGLFGSLANWNEFAMRLPLLVSTLISAWLAARLARRFWGEDEARLTPILYLSTAMVLWHGARMQIDPLLGALCTAALVLASERCESRARSTRLVLAAGLLTALAVLAKGPVAILLVGIPLAGWRWIEGKDPRGASRTSWAIAFFLALAPGLGWALAVVAREPELAHDLFVGQFFERALQGRNHISPFWYHLALQPLLMLPWTPLTLAGSWLAWRALRERWRGQAFDSGAAQAGWWLWALLAAFSLSPEKRDLYLLPVYPAVALLAARWIAEANRARRLDRILAVPAPALFALIAVSLCGAGLFHSRLPQAFPRLTWQSFAIGGPLLVGAAIAVVHAWRGGHARAAIALAAGLAGTACAGALLVFPLVDPLKSARSLASVVELRPERPTQIPCIGARPEGHRFYSSLPFVHGPRLRRELPNAVEAQELALLEIARREGAQFLALVQLENWTSWSEPTRDALEVLHEHRVGGRTVLVLGARRVPPR